jgi:DNA-binding transcriptional MerR regulator
MTETKKDFYQISDLSEEFGVTVRTIRYYEEVGLLSPHRTNGSHRIYSSRDRARLKIILRGKKFGFSLAEIKELLDLYDMDRTEISQIHTALEYGQKRLEQLDEMIHDLQMLKEEIMIFRDELLGILEKRNKEGN